MTHNIRVNKDLDFVHILELHRKNKHFQKLDPFASLCGRLRTGRLNGKQGKRYPLLKDTVSF